MEKANHHILCSGTRLLLVVVLARLLIAPPAAAGYRVAPGSVNNRVEIDVTLPQASGPLQLPAGLLSHPDWVQDVELSSQIHAGAGTVSLRFGVSAHAHPGSRGALVLSVTCLDASGERVASRRHVVGLRVHAEPPRRQEDYRIEECCIPATSVELDPGGRLRGHVLLGAVPNPAATHTRIRFGLAAEGGAVELSVHDITGRCVYRTATPRLSPGFHQIVWAGQDLQGRPVPPGLYAYRVSADGWVAAGRVLRLR